MDGTTLLVTEEYRSNGEYEYRRGEENHQDQDHDQSKLLLLLLLRFLKRGKLLLEESLDMLHLSLLRLDFRGMFLFRFAISVEWWVICRDDGLLKDSDR